MKFTAAALMGLNTLASAQDLFNYRSTSGTDFGPEEWNKVSCNNLSTCPGWPAKLEGSIGWSLTKNECEWCPATGNKCGQHRQSPIDLQRDRAIEGNPNEKECPDWHWIQYLDGTCDWEDMDGQFEIGRNALMIHTPLNNNGDIDCVNNAGERKFPKLDYSKGFPDWWYLSRTEITTPSEHVQQGKRYAAEVKLSHFYEIEHYKNKLGIISMFMQDFEGEPSWPYLDKLICQWRKEEEKKRLACGLPPAPVYKMCELYRGQVRTDDDFEAPTEQVQNPTFAPLVAPPAIPVVNFGGDPEEFRLPLGLCQGDCDFTSDCAPGLICYRRDALDPVPGCLGGENDDTNTDYCVFDPFGTGYVVPTEEPTGAPTITNRPTLVPLVPIPLTDFGGTPPADKFPLEFCQGDCDKDEDCAEGLICFQRTSNETVPGCIGGETDIKKTDYCILDPYGDGYEPTSQSDVAADPTSIPTEGPTATPTTTSPSPAPTTGIPSEEPTASPSEKSDPTSEPSFFPRPTGQPLTLNNLGWEPPTPLGECEGDCDDDSDCGLGLHCYQRNTAFQDVPGCLGGKQDATLTDYCAFKPLPGDKTAVPSDAPVSSPTASPTAQATRGPINSFPDLKNLTNFGWSPETLLGECEGDCDDDSDCEEGLICYQRTNEFEAVPGCLGGTLDDSLADFCISNSTEFDFDNSTDFDFENNANFDFEERVNDSEDTESPSSGSPTGTATGVPTGTPTQAPSEAPTTASPTKAFPVIVNLGWTPPESSRPLGLCEGDCDLNQDCGPGLKCFQRYLANVEVPGCAGGESDSSLVDYCVLAGYVDGTLSVPTASPTMGTTTQATAVPVENRIETSAPSKDEGIPPSLDCSAYPGVNFFRMCKEDSCCVDPRSSTEYCHDQYARLGDDVEAACHHCCLEEHGEARTVGSEAAINPTIPQVIGCDAVFQPDRTCRRDGCCDESGSSSQFCLQQYRRYSQPEMESICWYCCHPSKEISFDLGSRRQLSDTTEPIKDSRTYLRSRAALKQFYKNHTEPVGENDKVTHDVNGNRVIVRAGNFEEKGTMDEEAYFDELITSYKRRALQESQELPEENYDNVEWWPYEWFLKVGTEYYFRYEGTQTVPPCYDTAHWRVFKDPIRVAPHQMRELERLIAWRTGDNCQRDTAGKGTDDPNVVDVARPLQSTHRLHRKVFCECKDWPSKFPEDRQWCRKWQETPPEQRLFENPYNWPSNGFDFL